MILAAAYDQKVCFTYAGLKNWRRASTKAATDRSWLC